jgi:hypothetical protein
MRKVKQVRATVSAGLRDMVANYAGKKGISITCVVNMAIEEFLRVHEPKKSRKFPS